MIKQSSRLPLSPREQEILLLAADGLVDKEICKKLKITQSTISTYWNRLRQKLGAVSRPEAVAKALAIAYQDRIDELRESQLWMQLFIEAATEYAIFVMDASGKILSWNPGVQRVFGYEEKEFIGMGFDALFNGIDQAQGAAEREREIAATNGRSLDNRWHVRKDGVRIWCAGTLFALREGGDDVLWYAKIVRDDTEKKQLEMEFDARKTREDAPSKPSAKDDDLQRLPEADAMDL